MKITKEQKKELFDQFINLEYVNNGYINESLITEIIKNFSIKYNLYSGYTIYKDLYNLNDITFNVTNNQIYEEIHFDYKKELRKRKLNNILK